ncbi:MAG TPA: archaeosortase/exosortase family protein [Paludibacter sp.]|jgi:exosortase/archaeosortase family protein|nr:MAG: Transmembrane exosortase (Exosortase_EpsH) [Bacteroidetes bacterium ADurb.Bin174]HQB28283.1 archaeosortase/exosortase family protein [Paludibacter sp.]
MAKLKLPKILDPMQGIIYFFVILLAAHFFWKFTMLGDDSDEVVTFFGIDLSAGFNAMVVHLTEVVHKVLVWLGYNVEIVGNSIIRHDNGASVRIVWACTGYKQAYIFTTIILFYKGPFLKKLWYIPAGLVIVYLFNIFRMVMIIAAIRKNPESFDFLHEGLYKYIFYGIIFLMWVLWEEKFCKLVSQKEQVAEN